VGEVWRCGVCGSRDLSPILDMGDQPLAERMSEGKTYPLALLRCGDCTLVQLSHIVDQRELFPPAHPYSSGNTAAIVAHCRELADEMMRSHLSPGDLVVDIGANDGTLLRQFSPDLRRVAVEPTNQALKCGAIGVGTYQEFFTRRLAEQIAEQWGPAKLVTACNVLAHVPDPHDFVQGVVTLLGDDGVFLSENHDLRSITSGLQVDTVYHEHLRYYSVASLSRLLSAHGLEIENVTAVRAYGGSMRVVARPEAGNLQHRAMLAAAGLRDLMYECGQHDRIYGVGAATRAVPLIHYAKIAPYIWAVCEVAGSEKTGTTMPGTAIPVIDEKALVTDQPGYALLFPWQYADTLIPKLRSMGYKGRFIIPLPEPRITDGPD
jgi:hypothetical protein